MPIDRNRYANSSRKIHKIGTPSDPFANDPELGEMYRAQLEVTKREQEEEIARQKQTQADALEASEYYGDSMPGATFLRRAIARTAAPVERALGAMGVPGMTERADEMQRFNTLMNQQQREYMKGGIVPDILQNAGLSAADSLVDAAVLGVGGGLAGTALRSTGVAASKFGARTLGKSVYQGGRALGSSAGKKSTMVLGFGASSFDRGLTIGKDAGLEGEELTEYALRAGAAEAIPSAVLSSFNLGMIAAIAGKGGNTVRAAITNGAAEIPEELTAEFLQAANDKMSGVNENAISEMMAAESLAEVALAAFLGGGAPNAIGMVTDKITGKSKLDELMSLENRHKKSLEALQGFYKEMDEGINNPEVASQMSPDQLAFLQPYLVQMKKELDAAVEMGVTEESLAALGKIAKQTDNFGMLMQQMDQQPDVPADAQAAAQQPQFRPMGESDSNPLEVYTVPDKDNDPGYFLPSEGYEPAYFTMDGEEGQFEVVAYSPKQGILQMLNDQQELENVKLDQDGVNLLVPFDVIRKSPLEPGAVPSSADIESEVARVDEKIAKAKAEIDRIESQFQYDDDGQLDTTVEGFKEADDKRLFLRRQVRELQAERAKFAKQVEPAKERERVDEVVKDADEFLAEREVERDRGKVEFANKTLANLVDTAKQRGAQFDEQAIADLAESDVNAAIAEVATAMSNALPQKKLPAPAEPEAAAPVEPAPVEPAPVEPEVDSKTEVANRIAERQAEREQANTEFGEQTLQNLIAVAKERGVEIDDQAIADLAAEDVNAARDEVTRLYREAFPQEKLPAPAEPVQAEEPETPPPAQPTPPTDTTSVAPPAWKKNKKTGRRQREGTDLEVGGKRSKYTVERDGTPVEGTGTFRTVGEAEAAANEIAAREASEPKKKRVDNKKAAKPQPAAKKRAGEPAKRTKSPLENYPDKIRVNTETWSRKGGKDGEGGMVPAEGNLVDAPPIYLTGKSTASTRAAGKMMRNLGVLVTPATAQYRNHIDDYEFYAVDNGAISKPGFEEEKFYRLLDNLKKLGHADKALFASAPDVLGDMQATLKRSEPHFDRIRDAGFPVALVLQNGATLEMIPWDKIDVLFVGGDNKFKLAATDNSLKNEMDTKAEIWPILKEADKRGVPVHFGRVSSPKRLHIVHYGMGGRSVDGTFLNFGKTDKQLEKVKSWLFPYGEFPEKKKLGKQASTTPERDRVEAEARAATNDNELVDAVMPLIDAVAQRWANATPKNEKQRTPDDYFAKIGSITLDGDKSKIIEDVMQAEYATEEERVEALESARKANAYIRMSSDGRRHIALTGSANRSSLLHELAHLYRDTLLDSDPALARKAAREVNKILKAMGAPAEDLVDEKNPVNWSVNADEVFAEGYERFIQSGDGPPALKKIFEKMRQWISDVYDSLIDSRAPITNELADVYRQLSTKPPRRTKATKKPTEDQRQGRLFQRSRPRFQTASLRTGLDSSPRSRMRKGTLEMLAELGVDPALSNNNRVVARMLERNARKNFGTKIERKDFTALANLATKAEPKRETKAKKRERLGAKRRYENLSDKISNWMVEELRYAIAIAESNPERSAVGWYTTKYQDALNMLGKAFPEFNGSKSLKSSKLPGVKALGTRTNARNFFTALIAITSDGEKLASNYKLAVDQYNHFRETGELNTESQFARDKSMKTNLKNIANLMDKLGPAGMKKTLLKLDTVGNLTAMAESKGEKFKTPYGVDMKLPYATLVFGPKLGAFYANLMGQSEYLTMDRWWSRTFNRYRGNLITKPTDKSLKKLRTMLHETGLFSKAKAEGMSKQQLLKQATKYQKSYKDRKYKKLEVESFEGENDLEAAANTIYKNQYENLQDAPWGAMDRQFMIATTLKAQEKLENSTGEKMEIADIQAVLWYYEKELYSDLGARDSGTDSYEEIAREQVARLSGSSANRLERSADEVARKTRNKRGDDRDDNQEGTGGAKRVGRFQSQGAGIARRRQFERNGKFRAWAQTDNIISSASPPEVTRDSVTPHAYGLAVRDIPLQEKFFKFYPTVDSYTDPNMEKYDAAVEMQEKMAAEGVELQKILFAILDEGLPLPRVGDAFTALGASMDEKQELIYSGRQEYLQLMVSEYESKVRNFDRSKADIKKYEAESQPYFRTGKPVVAVAYHGSRAAKAGSYDPKKRGGNTGAPSARIADFFGGRPETAYSYSGDGQEEVIPYMGYANLDSGSKSLVRQAVRDSIILDFESAIEYLDDYNDKMDRIIEVAGLYESDLDEQTALQMLYEAKDEAEDRDDGDLIMKVFFEDLIQDLSENVMPSFAAKNPTLIKDIAENVIDADGGGGYFQVADEDGNFPEPEKSEFDTTPIAPNIEEVYVRLLNPMVVDQQDETYREDSYYNKLVEAKEKGHDGVIWLNTSDPGEFSDFHRIKDNIFAVFSNDQITNYISGKHAATGKVLFQRAQPASNVAETSTDIVSAKKEWAEKGTDSKYFKKWFGKSKIVDDAGKPMVVYHGTKSAFSEFVPSLDGQLGPGIYMSTSKKQANHYALPNFKSRGDGGNVMPLYVKMENPLRIQSRSYFQEQYPNQSEINEVKEQGYDGIVQEFISNDNLMIVAFDKSQVKSATGNRGTFDDSGKILFQSNKDLWSIPEGQEFDSADTSINANKLPITVSDSKSGKLKQFLAVAGKKNIDIGGGRFDNVAEFLAKRGIDSQIYDPYNRDADHNRKTVENFANGQSDTATVNNVLNVIKEESARDLVIRQAANAIKPDGTAFFLMYRDGKKSEGPTKSGYQLHRKGVEYVPEIEKHFGNVKVSGQFITATEPKKADAAVSTDEKILFQGGRAIDPVGMKERKRWFGKSKIVDEFGEPQQLYHGTPQKFTSFNMPTQKDTYSYFGNALYVTTNPEDSEINYASDDAPDMLAKVERRAEDINDNYLNDLTRHVWDDPDVADAVSRVALKKQLRTGEQVFSDIAVNPRRAEAFSEMQQRRLTIDVAEEMARKELMGSDPAWQIMPLIARVEKPVYLDSTFQRGETSFQIDVELDDDGDVISETGSGIKLLEALQAVESYYYGVEVDAIADLMMDGEPLYAHGLFAALQEQMIEDDDGNYAAGNFFSEVMEQLGYDGIVANAYQYFGPKKIGRATTTGMQGITPDTFHVMVFNPRQLKSDTGNRGTYDDSSDIRYQTAAEQKSEFEQSVKGVVDQGFDKDPSVAEDRANVLVQATVDNGAITFGEAVLMLRDEMGLDKLIDGAVAINEAWSNRFDPDGDYDAETVAKSLPTKELLKSIEDYRRRSADRVARAVTAAERRKANRKRGKDKMETGSPQAVDQPYAPFVPFDQRDEKAKEFQGKVRKRIGKKMAKRPLSKTNIIYRWANLFGVPVRPGGPKGNVLAYYDRHPEMVRMRNNKMLDLAVAAHEIAHHIDKKIGLNEKLSELQKNDKDRYDAVILQLSMMDYDKLKGRHFEGFAEGVRHLLTNTLMMPPKTQWMRVGLNDYRDALGWIHDTIMDSSFREAYMEAEIHVKMFDEQTLENKVKSQIGDQADVLTPGSSKLREVASAATQGARVRFFNRLLPVREVDEMAKERGYTGSTLESAMLFYKNYIQTGVTNVVRHGVTDITTGEPIARKRGGSIDDLGKLIKNDEEDVIQYAVSEHVRYMHQKRPEYVGPITIKEASDNLKRLKAKATPEDIARYEQFRAGVSNILNDLLTMRVDAGEISHSDAMNIRDFYGDDMFSFLRVQSTDQKIAGTSGARLVNMGPAIKGRTKGGSQGAILHPIDALIRKTQEAYEGAGRARVVSILAEMEQLPGMGSVIYKPDQKMKANSEQAVAALDLLRKDGILENLQVKALKVGQRLLDGEGGDLSQAARDAYSKYYKLPPALDLDALETHAKTYAPDISGMVQFFHPDFSPDPSQKLVRIVNPRTGKPEMWEIGNQPLYDVLTGLGPDDLGKVGGMLKILQRPFRAGAISVNVAFGAANLTRDYIEYQGRSRYSGSLKSIYRPLVHLTRLFRYAVVQAFRPEYAQKHFSNDLLDFFQTTGGALTSRIGFDVDSVKRERARILGKQTKRQRIMSLGTEGVSRLQDFIAVSDMPPRMAEGQAFLETQGIELPYFGEPNAGKFVDMKTKKVVTLTETQRIALANAMAEATTNFSRSGTAGPQMNVYLPFFNAAMQGTGRFAKQMQSFAKLLTRQEMTKEERQEAENTSVYIAVGLLGSVAYAFNPFEEDDDDYLEARSSDRDRYWIAGWNGKTHFRVPKPRDTAVMFNAIETLALKMKGKIAADGGSSFGDLAMRDLAQRIPSGGGILRNAAEVGVNYDYFRGREIESQYMTNKRNPVPKVDRTTAYTTSTAEYLGTVGQYFNLSPVQIEHLAQGYTGGGFARLFGAIESVSMNGKRSPGLRDFPGASAYVQNRYQAGSIGDIYDAAEDTGMALAIATRNAPAITDKASYEAYKEYYDKNISQLARKKARVEEGLELMKLIRDAETKTESGQRTFEFEPYINGVAREALDRDRIESALNVYETNDLPMKLQEAIKEHVVRKAKAAIALYGMPTRVAESDSLYEQTLDKYEAKVAAHRDWINRNEGSEVVQRAVREAYASNKFKTLYKFPSGLKTAEDYANARVRFDRQRSLLKSLREDRNGK